MKKKSNGRMPKGGRGSKKPLSLKRFSDAVARLRRKVDALDRRLKEIEGRGGMPVMYG